MLVNQSLVAGNGNWDMECYLSGGEPELVNLNSDIDWKKWGTPQHVPVEPASQEGPDSVLCQSYPRCEVEGRCGLTYCHTALCLYVYRSDRAGRSNELAPKTPSSGTEYQLCLKPLGRVLDPNGDSVAYVLYR